MTLGYCQTPLNYYERFCGYYLPFFAFLIAFELLEILDSFEVLLSLPEVLDVLLFLPDYRIEHSLFYSFFYLLFLF